MASRAPQFQPFQMSDPVQMLQSFAGISKWQREQAEQSRADEDRQILSAVAQEAPDDPDKMVTLLNARGRPQLALSLQEQILKARETEAETMGKRLDSTLKRFERASAIASGITDEQSFQRGRMLIADTLGPEIAQHLGERYDPATVQQALSWGSSETGRLTAQRDAATSYRETLKLEREMGKDAPEVLANWMKTAGQGLSVARTPEEWQGIRTTLQRGGAPAHVLEMFPQEFTPEGPALAAQMALTPEQRATIDDRAAQRDIQKQQVGIAQGQLDVARGNLGLRSKALEHELAKATTQAEAGKFSAALPVLDEIELLSLGEPDDRGNRSGRINRFEGVQASAAGAFLRGAARANYANDVAEYDALVKGFTPIVARALGHTGVLTEQDVQSVRSLFPQPGDSKTLAQNKLKRVRSLITQINSGTAGARGNAGNTGPLNIGGFEVTEVNE
jgi:hypothetical protein